MIVIFENSPVLAGALEVCFKKRGNVIILPSNEISSKEMAMKYLNENGAKISHILINAYASFQKSPDIMEYEGITILKDILSKEVLDDPRKILYSVASVKTLRAHGGKILFEEDHMEVFQFVKLPGVFPV